MTRWTRFLSALVLTLTLSAGIAPRHVLAQNDEAFAGANPDDAKPEGRPLDGYLATGVLVFIVLFIIGKSARR